MTFGAAFKNVMKERGWSQSQAARATGESRGKISHWCCGVNAPTVGDLDRIARLFGVVFVCTDHGWSAHLEEDYDRLCEERDELRAGLREALDWVAIPIDLPPGQVCCICGSLPHADGCRLVRLHKIAGGDDE